MIVYTIYYYIYDLNARKKISVAEFAKDINSVCGFPGSNSFALQVDNASRAE